MNGNDERGIVPAFNSSYSTVKINSLCIKLGIRKEKADDSKCSHFSIRGYAAGMRDNGNRNLLSFTEELPPMEVPNFRYWRCEKCLQNYNETANASTETALISVDDHHAFSPSANPRPRQDIYRAAIVPFGEGTSGSKAVDDAMVVDLEADESQTSEEMTDRAMVRREPTRLCITDTNIAGKMVINELMDHENSQDTSIVNETVSQPLEPGQEIDYQNGHPKRKTRKIRLLKELLCGNAENQQQKDDNLPSSPPRIKRKMLHDHDNDNDHDHDDDRHDPKRSKSSKAIAVPETNVTEPSRNPGVREFEESINRYEWNKTGAQRSSIQGRIGSDPMTAWRSIFSDMGRTENRVPPTYSAPRSRGAEPYPNFMNSLKSDKRVHPSKKIPSNPIKSKFFVEDSRRMQDGSRAGTGLGLDLSLNYDPQSNIQSQLSALNQLSNQDFSRKPGFFSAEMSNYPTRIQPDPMRLLERPVSYGGCSGHQKLDFSDPYKRNNTGVGGYSDFTRPNNNNNQRQENMFSIGRSDEREVIELMAKNQYERSLSEANNNGIISGFHKPMNEQMRLSHPEYLNMIRPGENVSPMRSPPGGFFHQDRISNFTTNQKKPFNGVWMSDVGPQRRYDYDYDYDSRYHYVSNGNSKTPQTHLYNPTNMQVLEGFNKYYSGMRQHEAGGMPFGQPYAKYSEKDKGKNMMNLDLNLVADEQNNFESLDVNRNLMRSFDSSYSNEAIPAMQLLTLMDAGKVSHQPFSLTGQTSVTKPKPRPNSSSFSHGGSIVTERTSSFVNPIGTSHTSGFRPVQNANLTSSSQPVVRPRGAPLASGVFQPVDSFVFPFPWQAGNRTVGPRPDPVQTDICVMNQNPADISSPGPDNPWMINAEDLVRKGGSSRGQIVKRKP
ncbi:uncharacterized protein LOC143551630 [Bidens hawaiensis]|uniref:uncharacterized protein LOC143551630 n=1 Tax=Bidens hawaiensis TaxID=980011 RepID=UPI00404B9C0E